MMCLGIFLKAKAHWFQGHVNFFLIVFSISNNYRFNVGLIPNKMLAKNMDSF